MLGPDNTFPPQIRESLNSVVAKEAAEAGYDEKNADKSRLHKSLIKRQPGPCTDKWPRNLDCTNCHEKAALKSDRAEKPRFAQAAEKLRLRQLLSGSHHWPRHRVILFIVDFTEGFNLAAWITPIDVLLKSLACYPLHLLLDIRSGVLLLLLHDHVSSS